MSDRVLLGDEAVALAAIHAGITAALRLPRHPSTEIMEFLRVEHELARRAARRMVHQREDGVGECSASPSPAAGRWCR